MRKIVSLLCLLMLLMTMFTGAAMAEEKTKVVIWSNARHDYDLMAQKIDEFNATNTDNIEIVYEVYTDNYKQVAELGFDTGNGPDIFATGGGAWDLAMAGQALPLNGFMTDADYEYFDSDKNIVESVNMFDGKILSLPMSVSTVRLVYNKGIFEKAGIAKVPATFEEVAAAAKQITEKLSGEGIYGFAINLKSPASALGRTLDYMVEANNGIHYGYNFKTGRYEFDKDAEIVNFLHQMFVDGSMFPGCDQLDIDPLRTQFAAGRIGMYYSYSAAEPGVYKSQFPTEEKWDFGPLTNNGNPVGKQGVDAGKYWSISKDTQNPEAAWKVMQFLYGKDLLSAHYANGLSISMLDAVIGSVDMPEQIKEHALMAKQDTDAIWPAGPKGLTLEGENYYSVFAGYILGIPGYEDLAKLTDDLNTRYNAALDKGLADGTVTAYVFPNFDPMDPAGTMN